MDKVVTAYRNRVRAERSERAENPFEAGYQSLEEKKEESHDDFLNYILQPSKCANLINRFILFFSDA